MDKTIDDDRAFEI